jgi:hypothetical protein
LIAAGKSLADAYIAAGYVAESRNVARANGYKLLRSHTVVSRLAEVQRLLMYGSRGAPMRSRKSLRMKYQLLRAV